MSASEVLPPQVRVEIFRQPALFDDHFLKGWTFTGGTPTRNGKTIALAAGQFAEKALSCSTASKRYLVYRVVAGSDFVVQIRRASDGIWVHASMGYSPGQYVADLQAAYVGDINGVRFYANSGSVEVDYLAVAEGFRVPNSHDLTEDLEVTLTLIKDGFAGAKITLTNFAEQGDPYDSEIDKNDVVLVWLSRNVTDLGSIDCKVFGGRVVNPIRQYENFGVVTLVLDCHGHAAELNAPPALLRKVYLGDSAKTIAEDAVALCNYLAPHPDGSKWFAGVNTYHAVDYDEVKPLTPLQETSEKAGFDVYETAEGALIAHTKMSASFVCPVTTWLRNAVKGDDLHPVRNRIKVYGAANKRLPSDGDQWTEGQALMWQYAYGYGFDYFYPQVGFKALGLSMSGNERKILAYFTTVYEGSTPYNVAALKWGYGKGSFKNIHFYWDRYAPFFTTFTHELRAYTDDNNYFYATLEYSGSGFKEENIALGEGNEYDPTTDESAVGKWRKVGSPTWATITKWAFYGESDPNGCTLYVDGLYFDGAECSGEAEDTASQAIYGVRVAEPISDTTLLTDAECLLKAKSLLAQLKNPELTVKEIVVDGDHRYKPGDRVTLLGVTFRIVQVKHQVKGATWDAVLTVGLT